MEELNLQDFRKLIELCVAFKEDIDFHEMRDTSFYDMSDKKTVEHEKALFQLKTAEDKVQQLLLNEYRKNRHSVLFDQMQDMIMKSRNGNLIGGLLVIKVKQHDFEDMGNIITSALRHRAGREAIEEIGKHYPKLLKIVEKVSIQSGDYKLINFACYIDGVNVNKLAHAVVKMNDIDKLQDFGEQHAEDLSLRTRKMLSHHFKEMESNMENGLEMEHHRHK